MNQREVEKHLVFQVSFLVFLIVTILFTVIWLLTDNVNASDYHNVVTNAIYTGTSHCSTNQTGLCVSDTSSTSYSRYTFGSNSYQNTLSINFWLNTSVRKNVNATIRLTGKNWANVNYTCQTNYFTDCRVVRASSTILNINFSNDSNGVSGVEFFITANGNVLNTNDLFYVQKADLYETNIVDDDSQNTQDVINNQNQNTEDIINNNNQNTQDVINNQNQNTQSIIDKMTDLSYPSCADGNRYFLVGSDKSYIASQGTGQVNKNNNYFVSQPIKIRGGGSYTLDIVDATGIQYGYYCFYNNLNQRVSCTKFTDNTTTSYTFTAPSNAVYFRTTLYRSNNVMSNASIKGYTCVPDTYENNVVQFHQLLEESEVNDFIKDDSNPSINNSAISDTLESVAIDDPLNYLLTLPLHTIQRINYHLGRNTCEPINLGSLLGTDLILPCFNVKNYLGASLFNTIDILMAIGLGAVTLKKFYDSISNVLTLGKEKEVREKLELPTPMEFFAMMFGGGR